MPPPFFGPFSREKVPALSFARQKELLRAFAGYYPRYGKLLTVTLLATSLAPAASAISPILILLTLRKYLPEGDAFMVILAMSGVAGLLVLGGLCDYAAMRWGALLGFRIEADMRDDLFCHLQTLSFSFYDNERSGTLLSRMTNDLTTVAGLAHRAPEILLSSILRFGSGVVIMMVINWRLALFAVLPAPLILLWLYGFQNPLRRSFLDVRKGVAELNAGVDSAIKGIRETQSFTNEAGQIGAFRSRNVFLLGCQECLQKLLALFHVGMGLLLHGYTRLFIAAGIVLVFLKVADTAELVAFFMYSHSITRPLMMLVDLVEQYQQGMAAFERFREIMEIPPAVKDLPGCLTALPEPLRGEIEFKNVRFRYGSADQEHSDVLKGVSLRILPGKKTAVVGESGAGKTTLGSLIPRFYEPCAGEILLDGRPVGAYSLKVLRSNIGIVSQMPFIFDGTVRENIAFGRPGASEEEIVAAARFAGIHDFIDSLPGKYDSRCGENGVKLSGGQRQRIAIARVFLKNPPILILDEATSSLDNESEAQVQAAFDKLGENRTVLVIAHRLSTIQDSDRICCMKEGRIVESGTHEELLGKKGYYYSLYAARNAEKR